MKMFLSTFFIFDVEQLNCFYLLFIFLASNIKGEYIIIILTCKLLYK